MTTKADRFGVIRLSAPQLQHPELLNGLDLWLQLGLLSQPQVKQFCQDYLTCAAAVAVSAVPVPPQAGRDATADFANADADSVEPAASSRDSGQSTQTSWASRALQAVMAEIGVIWLLCLGVFMVVVSSGVLAASQWRNFSAVGQYSILWAYTLAFWGVSWWTGRKAALRLTTRMLQTATLLIIPVNFWMMDGLRLWQTAAGIGINLLAAAVLTAILLSLTPQLVPAETRDRAKLNLTLLNSLGLSWLHWGWAIAGMPLIATYLGTIGTALLSYLQAERLQKRLDARLEASQPAPNRGIAPPALIVALATLLLLGRAILGAQVPVNQLGLAFGICGWLFCWLARRPVGAAVEAPLTHLWTKAGIALLVLGWATTVAADPPWQAVAVSGLGLWLLADRLRRQGTIRHLVTLLLLGLQTYALLWRLLPDALRQTILSTAAQWLGAAGMPFVLLGLAGFPYLWLMLAIAKRLRRYEQADLARISEAMALGLGGILVAISLLNPLVRSLSLSLATLTLTATLRPRTLAPGWLYFNHLLILVTIAAWINTGFPALNHLAWASILLLGMAIELGLSLGSERVWRRSCWHFGLGLAGLSYGLLPNWFAFWFVRSSEISNHNLIWLAAPVLLTGLSRFSFQQERSQLAAWLSTGGLVAQLFLLNSVDGWLISLGVATVLLLINTVTLHHLAAALLTIAAALGFEALALNRYLSLSFDEQMLLLAANLWLLWLLQDWLLPSHDEQPKRVSQLYAAAANFWAISIGLFGLISLSLASLAAYTFEQSNISLWLVLSSGLIVAAIAYQSRRGATNLKLYGLAWAAELVIVTLIGWQQGSVAALAIGTLALGLISQIAGDRLSRSRERTGWHLIPLLYAAFGVLLGHHAFTSTTGLYTLAAALIGIGVGRRRDFFKPLTLGSLLLGSFAAYELLIYQLMQASGEDGDGMTLMAGLAAAIALLLRLGQGWLLPYLRLQRHELARIANLHWGFGSGLALVAVSLSLSDRGFLLWLLFAATLTAYALAHGRTTAAPSAEPWTYLGILEGLGLIGYVLYRTLPDREWLMVWAATIAAIVAVGMYFLPWQSWGWSRRPWQNLAMLLPSLIVLLTVKQIALQSLLIVAAFYAWIAKADRRPRLSYLSVLLFDWAALRFLGSEGWLNLTWISSLMAASLLYVAQIDPVLQSASAKEQRHWLRSLAVGLLSLTMFYQAEIEPNPTALLISLLTLGLAIALIFLGLVLRVRAFLYVGTATFVLKVLRLLWLFVNNYSLLLWAIGIVIGLLFIWVAATFEARRHQMSTLMQYWLSEFTNWE